MDIIMISRTGCKLHINVPEALGVVRTNGDCVIAYPVGSGSWTSTLLTCNEHVYANGRCCKCGAGWSNDAGQLNGVLVNA